jgi:hypothetical protein
MTRNLQRRLQKLESQVPRQPTEQEKKVQTCQNFLMLAMAYYLGDPRPEEAPITAYGRALGYPNSHEFQKAWDANDPDIYERDRLARIKLLAKFGVSREHESEEIVEALERMEAGLPEQYKACYRQKNYTGRDHAI